MKRTIIDGYINYTLENGRKPDNVRILCQSISCDEMEFYQYFNSLDHLDKQILPVYFEETSLQIKSNEAWPSFSGRERVLMLFFTVFQNLKKIRSFLLLQDIKGWKSCQKVNSLKEPFIHFLRDELSESIKQAEIKTRGFSREIIYGAIWTEFQLVYRFWLGDESQNFDQTDALIEKVVHTTFDTLGNNFIDSAFDLGKFLVQKTILQKR